MERNAELFICFQAEVNNSLCKIEGADLFPVNKSPQGAFYFYASWLSFKCILTVKFSITRQVKASSLRKITEIPVTVGEDHDWSL